MNTDHLSCTRDLMELLPVIPGRLTEFEEIQRGEWLTELRRQLIGAAVEVAREESMHAPDFYQAINSMLTYLASPDLSDLGFVKSCIWLEIVVSAIDKRRTQKRYARRSGSAHCGSTPP